MSAVAIAQELKMSTSLSETSRWTLMVSPATTHFSDWKKSTDPSEVKHSYVWLVGAERKFDDRYFAGAAFFSNSFGQRSQYVYAGAKFRPLENTPEFFAKVSAGVIHGYKAPYNKKIPINTSDGWGLGVIPSIGWDFTEQTALQINLLGAAGLMMQLNTTLK
jgi:hypothetical protein